MIDYANKFPGKAASLVGALLATAGFVVPACAQTGQAQTSDSNATSDQVEPAPERTGEIVVTARRRSEKLIDVPAAVTAFTAADLEARGVQKPQDFLSATPGVFFRNNTTSGTSFINIRGVTQSRNAESPVAIVVDGVFLNNPLSFNNNLVDIEQIEVLKGPQGALYGRNASAGAIIVTTHEPGDALEGIVKAGYGNHQSYRAEASITGPLVNDQLFFGATLYATGTDGFLKNEFLSLPGRTVYQDPERNIGGRARLIYKPNDGLKFDLRFGYTETKGNFNNDIFNPTNIGDNSILQVPYTSNILGFNNRKTYDASLKVDVDTSLGTLTAVTGYNNLKEAGGGDALPYSSSTADGTQWLLNEYETLSQEVRLTSPEANRLRYIFGAYYQHTDRFFASSTGTDTGGGLIIIDRTGAASGPTSVNPSSGGISATAVRQNAWAVFGSLAYDIADSFELSAALRYDKDEERATNRGALGPGFTANPLLGTQRMVSFDKVQPKATLRYKLDGGGNIYATYAQGFKTGGFNPQGVRASSLMTNPNTPIRDEFGAETTTTFEAGYKAEFFDRRVRFGVAAYHNNIAGANYFDFIPTAANQLNINIDKVEAYGVETDLTANLTSSLTATGSFSWTHSEIKVNRVDPTTQGKPAPGFPSVTANIALQWQDHISETTQAVLRIEDQYRGRIYWDTSGKVRNQPVNLIDARAGLIFGDDNSLRVDLYCKNCTNRDYVNETIALSAGISVTFPATNTRQFGLEVTKRF
jgi:iron complex outermembrane recepter protein